MLKYDMCSLLFRCEELSGLGEETTFHYLPRLNRVTINHYHGSTHDSHIVTDDNYVTVLSLLERRIFQLRRQYGKRD